MACGCKKNKTTTVKTTLIQSKSQTLKVGTKKTRDELIAELKKRLEG